MKKIIECGDLIRRFNPQVDFIVDNIIQTSIFGGRTQIFKTDKFKILKKAVVIPKKYISEIKKGEFIRTEDNLYVVWEISKIKNNTYSITVVDLEHRNDKKPRENHFGWLNNLNEDLTGYCGGKIEIIENPFEKEGLKRYLK